MIHVEAPHVQTVNVHHSSDGQQLLPHGAHVNVLWSACTKQKDKAQHRHQVNNIKTDVQLQKVFLPCSSILKTSFVIGIVVPRTRTENKNVQIGSATLYSGCEEQINMIKTNSKKKIKIYIYEGWRFAGDTGHQFQLNQFVE